MATKVPAARNHGLRFAASAAAGSLLCLSLVSGKQAYYLIPAMPMTAICLAWMISRCNELVTRSQALFMSIGTAIIACIPMVLGQMSHDNIQRLGQAFTGWSIAGFFLCGLALIVRKQLTLLASVRLQATCSAAVICLLLSGLSNGMWQSFDMQPLGIEMKSLADNQVPIAWYGDYHGQLGFAGRMVTPIDELFSDVEVEQWLVDHPRGRVIVRSDHKAHADEHRIAALPGTYIESQFSVQRGLNKATLSIVTPMSERIATGRSPIESN